MDIYLGETIHYKQLHEILENHELILDELIHDDVNFVYKGKWNGKNAIIKFIQDMPETNCMKGREINIIHEFNRLKLDINIPIIL